MWLKRSQRAWEVSVEITAPPHSGDQEDGLWSPLTSIWRFSQVQGSPLASDCLNEKKKKKKNPSALKFDWVLHFRGRNELFILFRLHGHGTTSEREESHPRRGEGSQATSLHSGCHLMGAPFQDDGWKPLTRGVGEGGLSCWYPEEWTGKPSFYYFLHSSKDWYNGLFAFGFISRIIPSRHNLNSRYFPTKRQQRCFRRVHRDSPAMRKEYYMRSTTLYYAHVWLRVENHGALCSRSVL